MPWPEVKLTVRARDGIGGGPALGGVLALGFDRDLLLAPDVQFPLGVGLLVDLAAFGRGRDRIEDAALGDAGLDMLGDQLVAVAGDANPGIAGLGAWGGGFRSGL